MSVTPGAGVRIRPENSGNLPEQRAIHAVNAAAFGGPDEADLVDQLRADADVLISLVATLEDEVIGHILFGRMWIETGAGLVPAVALAPMAIFPEHQRKGIGSRLIQHGLESLRGQGEKIIIVVGHPGYYPRFGFSTGKARLLESPFPPETFMAMELSPGALNGIEGQVIYPPAFKIPALPGRRDRPRH